MQDEGIKGGANGRRKWWKIQARSAERRYERLSLAGGGWQVEGVGRGQQTGERQSTPGEEVGSGCTNSCYDDKQMLVVGW